MFKCGVKKLPACLYTFYTCCGDEIALTPLFTISLSVSALVRQTGLAIDRSADNAS